MIFQRDLIFLTRLDSVGTYLAHHGQCSVKIEVKESDKPSQKEIQLKTRTNPVMDKSIIPSGAFKLSRAIKKDFHPKLSL